MRFLRVLLRLFAGNQHGSRSQLANLPRQQGVQMQADAHAIRPVTLRGKCWVIDGDTIVIDRVHIRLAGIDAPELDHPYGKNAKSALIALCSGKTITAITTGAVSHDRAVAECFLPDGRNLSEEMVKAGFALDWAKHSGGKYRHLEAPEARKKFWRADARQKGRFPPSAGSA